MSLSNTIYVTAPIDNRTSGKGIFSSLLLIPLLACVSETGYNQASLASSSDWVRSQFIHRKSCTRSDKTFACFFASTRFKNTSNSSMVGLLCGADLSQVADSFGAILLTLHNSSHLILVRSGIELDFTNPLPKEAIMNNEFIRDTPPENHHFLAQQSIISLLSITKSIEKLTVSKQEADSNFYEVTGLINAANQILPILERQVHVLGSEVEGV